jgi:hypothetical protein
VGGGPGVALYQQRDANGRDCRPSPIYGTGVSSARSSTLSLHHLVQSDADACPHGTWMPDRERHGSSGTSRHRHDTSARALVVPCLSILTAEYSSFESRLLPRSGAPARGDTILAQRDVLCRTSPWADSRYAMLRTGLEASRLHVCLVTYFGVALEHTGRPP